jgi:hypothetical protein
MDVNVKDEEALQVLDKSLEKFRTLFKVSS